MNCPQIRFLALATLILGCSRPEAAPQAGHRDQADSIRTMLAGVDEQPFRTAFERASTRAHRRLVRTEVYDPKGDLERSELVRITWLADGGVARVEMLEGAAEAEAAAAPPMAAGIPSDVLPEAPAYRSPAGRDAYRYVRRPDTTVLGRRLQHIEITALPGEADGRPLRRVQLFIDSGQAVLVGARVLRARSDFLLEEETWSSLWLRPLGEGTWVPHHLATETRFRPLLQRPRWLRTHASFYDYGPPPP